jgi:hypothetical protein
MVVVKVIFLLLTLIKDSEQVCGNCSTQTIPTATHVKKLMTDLFLKSYNKEVIPMLYTYCLIFSLDNISFNA